MYLVAICACHVGLEGKTGATPFGLQLHEGLCRRLPVFKPLVQPWDPPTVLDTLQGPVFEPLELASLQIVSLKTVLLSISSSKQRGEIHFF